MKGKVLIFSLLVFATLLFSGCVDSEPLDKTGKEIKFSDEWNKPVNLGVPVNTSQWEDGPSISPNGKVLYFTIGQGLNVDAFHSKKSDGKWGKPIPFGFNQQGLPEGAVHSQDNIIFYYASMRPDSLGEADIYVMENEEVRNIGSPVNTEHMESEPFISLDGETLFFGSTRPDGLGGTDIWFSTKVNGLWSKPINIGYPVNSEQDDTQPFVTSDGSEIYFTSVNRKGYGGPAIFVSKKSSQGWSEPEVVVSNFVGEPTLTQDGKQLYFVHLFNSNGAIVDADIFVVERKE